MLTSFGVFCFCYMLIKEGEKEATVKLQHSLQVTETAVGSAHTSRHPCWSGLFVHTCIYTQCATCVQRVFLECLPYRTHAHIVTLDSLFIHILFCCSCWGCTCATSFCALLCVQTLAQSIRPSRCSSTTARVDDRVSCVSMFL